MSPQDEASNTNTLAKPRRLTVGYAPLEKPGTYVPCLRLRGHWLEDAGFGIGRNVKIEVSEGRLTIEPVD